jgi:serine/threonine protein phosphatase PrpC
MYTAVKKVTDKISERMNFKLNIGCHLERGGREYQEDRIVAFEIPSLLDDNMNHIKNKCKCYIFCIFDGHGGDKCSKYLSKQFHIEIMRHSKFETFPIIALQETWAKLDELFYNECQNDDDTADDAINNGRNNIRKKFPTDGSTATLCMIINNDIYVTNCGDSSAYLVNINDNFNIDESSANAVLNNNNDNNNNNNSNNNNNNNNTSSSSSSSSSIPSSVVIVSNIMNGNYKKVNDENIILPITTPTITNTNNTTNTYTTTNTTSATSNNSKIIINDYSIYKKYTYQQLTEDHGTHNNIEKLRCEKAGAIMIEQFYMIPSNFPFCCLRKKFIGKPRISPGGLLVTRSFGDFYAKKPFLGKYF